MRVLIKVDKATFDNIPEDSTPYDIQKFTGTYLSAFLSVQDYKNQIEFVTRRLYDYMPDMIKSDYYIANVNIVKEIDRLKLVSNDIERYFGLNNIQSLQSEGVLEIGFDYSYSPIFTLIENCQYVVGYDYFLDSPLLNHNTTANYLMNLSSMYYELQHVQSIDPSKFFDIFGFYERYTYPRIMISAKSVPSDGMPAYSDGMPAYDDNGESFGLADLSKILSSQLSINLCKTEEEKQNEDKHLMDPATRLQIALAADQGRQLVSDFKLSSKGAQDLKKRMTGIKTAFTPGENNGLGPLDIVYNDVLAKLNLGCVLEETLQCYLERLVTLTGEAVFDDPDLTKVVNPNVTFGSRLGLKCDDKGCDGTIDIDFRVGLPVFQGITIPSNLPTTDLLASTMENVLEQLYMALVNALTSLILGTIQNSCEFLFTDVLGEGVASATIKDGFKNWLGNTIGVPADSLGDDEAWKDAVMSKGGSGFMGIVGNTVANMGEAFESAYSGTGISLNVPKDGNVEEVFFTPETITTFFKEFKDVTEDAEVILNEQELHGVYKGTSSYETIELVYNCAVQRNPKFASLFKDPYELADLFSALGKLVDSKFLDEPLLTPPSVPSNMCDLGDGSDVAILRAYLLQQKDDIPQSEIDAIFDKEKERTKQKLLQSLELLDRYNNGDVVSEEPNIFGTKDSLISDTPSSLSDTIGAAAAGSFDAVLNGLNPQLSHYNSRWSSLLSRDIVAGTTRTNTSESTFLDEQRGEEGTYHVKNPVSMWADTSSPNFEYLDSAYDYYTFSFSSYENMYNFAASTGGSADAPYAVITEWSFTYEFKAGGGNYNDLSTADRGAARSRLETIFEKIDETYEADIAGWYPLYERQDSIIEFILDWYEFADENSAGGGVGSMGVFGLDIYAFIGGFSWNPALTFYVSFSAATGLISFQTRIYDSAEDRSNWAPSTAWPRTGLDDREMLFLEVGTVAPDSDISQIILQVARQDPRFISTQPFYGGGSDIRSAFPTYIGQEALAPTTKRDVTSVSYIQQRDYISTDESTLGRTGFHDIIPTFATGSFSYNNKYPETYTESGILGGHSLSTSEYSDAAGFLGRMVKRELLKQFPTDSTTIDAIATEISTNVYYDITNQFLQQIKRKILMGNSWSYALMIGRTDLRYPDSDPLNYSEFLESSKLFAQDLIPLSYAKPKQCCEILSPVDQTQSIYATKMFIRLAILEHVMTSVQVCDAFDMSWMQGEMFATSIMSEIQEKIYDYRSAFRDTLENNLWDDMTSVATVYFELKYALRESEKKTYANPENALQDLIREEAELIRESLVDAFGFNISSANWDAFLRQNMFVQFDAAFSATSSSSRKGANADLFVSPDSAILTCFAPSTSGIGILVESVSDFDFTIDYTFENGGGLMFETYVKYKEKGTSDYNIIGVNDFIEGLNDLDESDILSDIYDYITFGIRLCLITSVSGAWTSTTAIREDMEKLTNIDDISDREKAYILSGQAMTIRGSTNDVAYISIPLAFAENEYDSSTLIAAAQEQFEEGEYEDSIYGSLTSALIDTEEYQILMDNLFPIKDQIAAFSLYASSVMTNATTIRQPPDAEEFDRMTIFNIADAARLATLQILEASLHGSEVADYKDPFTKRIKS